VQLASEGISSDVRPPDVKPPARPTQGREPPEPKRPARSAHERFLAADDYRVAREWARYEGTAQRDLFRELRRRFLTRHASRVAWALDAGSGPLRFTSAVGGEGSRRVALDLSVAMLRYAPPGPRPGPDLGIDRVRGDVGRPPFAPRSFGVLALLGNTLGFAGADSRHMLDVALDLVAPGGTVLAEIAPGTGEHSRYLTRLPRTAVGRLLRSPTSIVLGRVGREGFALDPPRRDEPGDFERYDPSRLSRALSAQGCVVEETIAIAPALGSYPEYVETVRRDPKAWERLLTLEEALGRDPKRWPNAAAVLLAVKVAPAA
jgi:hypothetical protein